MPLCVEGLPRFERYTIETTIGVGGFGRVYRGVRKADGRRVALKVIDLDMIPDDLPTVLEEVSNVSLAASSPHVLGFLDVFFPPGYQNRLVLVLEWATGGTLSDICRGPIEAQILYAVTIDALLGLRHLHEQCHLVHRDIKASNLLIDRINGRVKLSDFGSATTITGTTGYRLTTVGTPGWIAPEVAATLRHDETMAHLSVALPADLSGAMPTSDEVHPGAAPDGYRYEADIWSLGVTLLEIAMGVAPTADIVRSIKASSTEPLVLPNGTVLPPEFVDLLSRMFEPLPVKRPSAAELLEHPCLRDLLAYPSRRCILLQQLAAASCQLEDDEGHASLCGSEGSAASDGTADESSAMSGATLLTTSWNVVNPAIASLLHGKDITVGTALSVCDAPAVYQRSRVHAGLRAADNRDYRAYLASHSEALSDGAGDPDAASTLPQLLQCKSRPFSALYSSVIFPSVQNLWGQSNILDWGQRAPADNETREAYINALVDALSDCEASVPGFSSRFLVGCVESASAHPSLSDRLLQAATRGVGTGLAHVDAGAPLVSTDDAVHHRHAQSPAFTPVVWVQNPAAARSALPILVRDPLKRAEVVITSAASNGTDPHAAVEICSLLFETWKKDAAKAAVRR